MASINIPQTFDMAMDQAAIERKRQLAQALMQQSMQPQQGQMVSGHFVRPSPLQMLAQVAGAYFGNRMNKEADVAAGELQKRHRSELAIGLEKFFNTSQGRPGQVLSTEQAGALLNNDQNPGPLAEPIQANPRKAMIEAMASQVPELRQIGMMGLQSALKPTDAKPTQHVINGRLVETVPGSGAAPKVLGEWKDPKDQWGDAYSMTVDGKTIQVQKNVGTGQIRAIGSGGVNVNVDTKGEAEFAKKLGGLSAETIGKSRENAQTAVKLLDSLDNAQADLTAGIKSGATGEIALGWAKVAKALGMDDDPTIANTEAFKSNMAREVMQLVKNFGSGTGISNADRDYAEKASGGKITLDDKAMIRLLGIARQAAGNVIMEHKDLLGKLRSQPNLGEGTAAQLSALEVPLNVQDPMEQLDFDSTSRRFRVKGPAPLVPLPQGKGASTPSTSGNGFTIRRVR